MLSEVLSKDYSAIIFHELRYIKLYALHYYYTYLQRFLARLQKVELGRGVIFNGPITISRFKYSRICIGDKCMFNSRDEFNPRGTRPSILMTLTDKAMLSIGEGCGMSGVSIIAHKKIIIGNNTMIGTNTKIADNDDHGDILGTGDEPVIIGNNVFVGMNCLIMKGVTIGDNAIVGAGSIVTHDIPANMIAAGIPCKVIKMRQ